MTRTRLSPEKIVALFNDEFGEGIQDATIREWAEGVKRKNVYSIWIRLDRSVFKDAVRRLVEIDYPHLGVISGTDLGDDVELLYHFFIYFGIRDEEIKVTLAVPLPKSDPTIPSIADIIPGAVYSEREKQEMLGVKVEGIPDSRGLFLPEDFPEGIYPWRKDETGIRDDMVKDLWAVGRPTDRPAPPVTPKEEIQEEESASDTSEVSPGEPEENTQEATGPGEGDEIPPEVTSGSESEGGEEK